MLLPPGASHRPAPHKSHIVCLKLVSLIKSHGSVELCQLPETIKERKQRWGAPRAQLTSSKELDARSHSISFQPWDDVNRSARASFADHLSTSSPSVSPINIRSLPSRRIQLPNSSTDHTHSDLRAEYPPTLSQSSLQITFSNFLRCSYYTPPGDFRQKEKRKSRGYRVPTQPFRPPTISIRSLLPTLYAKAEYCKCFA